MATEASDGALAGATPRTFLDRTAPLTSLVPSAGIVWIYTIAQIVLAGVELTPTLQRHQDERIGVVRGEPASDESSAQPA